MTKFHKPPDDWRCDCGCVAQCERSNLSLKEYTVYLVACVNSNCPRWGKIMLYRPAEMGGKNGLILGEFDVAPDRGGHYGFTGFKYGEQEMKSGQVKYTMEGDSPAKGARAK